VPVEHGITWFAGDRVTLTVDGAASQARHETAVSGGSA
jgi:hypothetical protein